MLVSIYYKPSLFNAHTMILIVHIFMNVNKICLNQQEEEEGGGEGGGGRERKGQKSRKETKHDKNEQPAFAIRSQHKLTN